MRAGARVFGVAFSKMAVLVNDNTFRTYSFANFKFGSLRNCGHRSKFFPLRVNGKCHVILEAIKKSQIYFLLKK